jgi:membrane associated rhomboid family serine protease
MRSFEIPHAMVALLIALNVAAFAFCALQSGGSPSISPAVLFRYGAMYSQAIDRQEYWRLIAHGFLHTNPLHIFSNMLCLVLWGGLLEKRVGSFFFTLIYVSAIVIGGIASNVLHPGPYLSAGASGAISGVLGALLCLRILGKIGLDWGFFGINIGLNVAVAVSASTIDWQAHLGGFLAGMVVCALLDAVEKALPWVLRCKFPESVKMNAFIVVAAAAAYGSWHQNGWVFVLACALAGLVLIKLLDVVLSTKKGLAVVVVAFALANGAIVLLLRDLLATALGSVCAGRQDGANAVAAMICGNIDGTLMLVAVIALAITILACWPAFARGLSDVGFVGATLRGERNRRRGL